MKREKEQKFNKIDSDKKNIGGNLKCTSKRNEEELKMLQSCFVNKAVIDKPVQPNNHKSNQLKKKIDEKLINSKECE
jgi:hypothetical protein